MPVASDRARARWFGRERRAGLRSAAGVVAWLLLGALCAGCGGRTGLDSGPPLPKPPECEIDADCKGAADRCQPVACVLFEDETGGEGGGAAARRGGECVLLEPVDCDDNDPCTLDLCAPETGACRYEHATLDLDGDGHRAPLPGMLPGEPGSCGDDCDDTNPDAFPGGVEVCDGVDNDCNGIVDDGQSYAPSIEQPVRISGDIAPSGPGGFAWSGTSYAATYTGTKQGFRVYSSQLTPAGETLPPGETAITLNNADATGGPIVWTGDRYGLAWQDRRDGDYEVYFTLLDVSGNKALPDTRVTFAPDFSVNVALGWNGTEFLPVWQDRRESGLFNLYAQRISVDGALIGSNVALTNSTSGFGNEAPAVAAGSKGIGVAWSVGDALTHFIQFQIFAPDLQPLTPPISLTDGTTEAVSPVIVANNDTYVVGWYDKSAFPKAVYGAVISDTGVILVPQRAVSSPGSFRSRYPSLRPLGDRLLFVYADDRDQNDGYELYTRTVSDLLLPQGPEQRVTFAAKDSIYPLVTFGPPGSAGILFKDLRLDGAHHVFFTSLACGAQP